MINILTGALEIPLLAAFIGLCALLFSVLVDVCTGAPGPNDLPSHRLDRWE